MRFAAVAASLVSVLLVDLAHAQPQATTSFTYQGRLLDQGTPYDGFADVRLVLYTADFGGTTIGAPSLHENTPVVDGLFTIRPDFGADVFTSSNRWIELQVRAPAGSGLYSRLSPRQPITPAPLAVQTRGIFVDESENVRVGVTSGGSANAKVFVYAEDRPPLELQRDDSAGDEPATVLDLTNRTTEILNAGFGTRINLRAQSSNNANASIAQIDALWTNPNIANSNADLVFRTRSPGSPTTLPERMRLTSTGRAFIGRDFFITANEYFGIEAPVDNDFGGMYVNTTGANGEPFYGYATNGDVRAYHHYDPVEGKWILNINTNRWLTVTDNGAVGINNNTPNARLDIVQNQTLIDGVRIEKAGGGGSTAALLIEANSGARGIEIDQANTSSGVRPAALEIDTTGNSFPIKVDVVGGDSRIAEFNMSNSTSTSPAVEITADNPGPTLRIESQDNGISSPGLVVVNGGPSAAILGSQFTATNSPAIDGISVEENGTGIGVRGRGASIGVYGSGDESDEPTQDLSRFGVYGEATVPGTSTNYGVYGVASGAILNYAGYFDGDVRVLGSVIKNGGSFRIDHPLDPENKYLNHSFVESDEMMNIYNGNVVTDEQGFATVELPEWFEALNRDFRYQLTPIGQFAQAIIAEEISDKRFVIRTDKPHVKVSWQVTGVRHDPWANANRIEVEQLKPESKRGTYSHPELYGAPASMGETYNDLPRNTITDADGE